MPTFVQKACSLLKLLVLVTVLGVTGYAWISPYPVFRSGCDPSYTVCARVSELILASSSAKTALSEGMQAHQTWSAAWMSGITIAPTGMIASARIGPTGQIIVSGTAPTAFSTVTMTPTTTTDYKLVWSCHGEPAKYMPASCRS
jgi:type IV pilus assembly protein PilA